MEENLKTQNWLPSAMIKAHVKSSLHPRQQNGIVEWKNRVIQEMARVMLHNKKLPKSFWGEAVNTVCHTLNQVYFRPDSKKTTYEL